jgi:hypothetical protein
MKWFTDTGGTVYQNDYARVLIALLNLYRAETNAVMRKALAETVHRIAGQMAELPDVIDFRNPRAAPNIPQPAPRLKT